MQGSAKRLAESFVGAAKNHPDDRYEIFRRAASAFVGLAQDPRNARAAGNLAKVGLKFANAASVFQPVTVNDFVDLLHETHDAYEDAGDNHMEQVAREREMHEERTRVLPGNTSIAPASFNKDATLGRSAMVTFAPTPNQVANGITQSQNVAFWQGVKKEAQAMTVDISLGFSPVQNGNPESGVSNRPYAEIEFGSDGNRTKVRTDISLGLRTTVVGNYVAVTVGMDPPTTNSDSGVLTVGASIGAFAAPSHAPVLRTVYVDNLQPGDLSDEMPIPLKAVQLLPVQTSFPVGGLLVIAFSGYDGTLISDVSYLKSNVAYMTPIPIPGDAAFVSVLSDPGNPTVTQVRLPFQLGL